ncbi:MAG: M3 family oligoendopeptidase [Candidatus Omnitrophica bacterium]|nr:M3 family oligoendopeptidase [Candidatus Omnitrophota bacterium]
MLKNLYPFAERRFVPKTADLTSKDELVVLYQSLLGREISTVPQLEAWLLDCSELSAAYSQAASIIYIEMTCQTDDPQKARAYQDLIENVEPVLKPFHDAINRKYLTLRERLPLPRERYEVFDRAVRTAVELFVEKNIPLQTDVALLSQEYQAISGAMMVDFEGRERTLPEMAKFLMETDRPLRERAWRATAERRRRDEDRIEGIFEKMMPLRHAMAVNAGFKNFRDYQFKAYLRFDYNPQDCKAYHRTIKECVLPLKREIDLKRRADMSLDILRPWDTAVDPLARPALKPFTTAHELVSGTGQIIQKLDEDLSGFFKDMSSHGLLDLQSRKGKAPGGYQNTLSEARKPFIFMNAVGIDDDVRTLLHESGHAFHAYLSAHDPLDDYRHAPMEFCEVASMSMEFMGNDYLSVFYSKDDANRSVVEFLEGVISVLVWVATIDSFQHWMYENPKHSREERCSFWLKGHDEFGGGVVDWQGLEQERASLWHRQLHIFEVPFYYIEYGIAQLGALQIWRQFRHSPQKAVANYKKALALGGSRPLPELFSAAGIKFDFSKDMIAPLMDDVFKEWKRLSA